MLRYRPYETMVIDLDFKCASRTILCRRLFLTLEDDIVLLNVLPFRKILPTLEVIEAEAFHIEFLHTLIGDDRKPVCCAEAC